MSTAPSREHLVVWVWFLSQRCIQWRKYLLRQECNYERNLMMDAPTCTICCVGLPSSSWQHSLTPEASSTNKRVVEFLFLPVFAFKHMLFEVGEDWKLCSSAEAVKGAINELQSKFSLLLVTELFKLSCYWHFQRSRSNIQQQEFITIRVCNCPF